MLGSFCWPLQRKEIGRFGRKTVNVWHGVSVSLPSKYSDLNHINAVLSINYFDSCGWCYILFIFFFFSLILPSLAFKFGWWITKQRIMSFLQVSCVFAFLILDPVVCVTTAINVPNWCYVSLSVQGHHHFCKVNILFRLTIMLPTTGNYCLWFDQFIFFFFLFGNFEIYRM